MTYQHSCQIFTTKVRGLPYSLFKALDNSQALMAMFIVRALLTGAPVLQFASDHLGSVDLLPFYSRHHISSIPLDLCSTRSSVSINFLLFCKMPLSMNFIRLRQPRMEDVLASSHPSTCSNNLVACLT